LDGEGKNQDAQRIDLPVRGKGSLNSNNHEGPENKFWIEQETFWGENGKGLGVEQVGTEGGAHVWRGREKKDSDHVKRRWEWAAEKRESHGGREGGSYEKGFVGKKGCHFASSNRKRPSQLFS